MTMQEFQTRIDELVQQYQKPYWEPLSNLARLAEEVGEVSRILNARYGDKPYKPTDEQSDLGEELADVIWTVACIANSQNIQLEPHLQAQFAKLTTRDKDRFAKKDTNR